MINIKKLLIICSLSSLISGCSPDITEISDIALVMATAIDYDIKKHTYIFTGFCVLPSSTSLEASGKLTKWVESSTGDSIMEAAQNLRGRAGKTLIWQHNKFLIIGEDAARHSLYEILDYLDRIRQIRLTSYMMISEGKAADKLKLKPETDDSLTNELMGVIRNEQFRGKSINLLLKDFTNWYPNPYRGLVSGKISNTDPSNHTRKTLSLDGGAIFNKGRFIGWLNKADILSVRLLSEDHQWEKLEFSNTMNFDSSKVSLLYHVSKQKTYSSYSEGSPKVTINLNLKVNLVEMEHTLQINDPKAIQQLENSAARHIEMVLSKSITYFQKDLKIDVLGISDYFIQYHPSGWNKMKDNWDNIFATIPIQLHVNVKIDKLGMIQTLGAK
ncbi:Ger(x)C family spore germination protein [Paenibacillus psychroresistens]|uniref:Ger(X)C family spore germination protein n=1 Tax=Paenibacillus psychroresistens TaxID=1778678 RepID=A0A6B8RRJ4_9BACL|nr:Ger(x)C family spore germination protein [Paenibacillus psychroresistens]QGQ97888.1 Ger(x)C family spore germination protein [Paenibacillus psychroresistens]